MSRQPRSITLPTRWARETASSAVQNLAFQDVAALVFHFYLTARATSAPDSADAEMARRACSALLTITICTVVLARGEILPKSRIRALVYRIGIFFPVVLSYFALRYLLPSLQPRLLDHHLWAIDEWMVGTTPAVWMAQFNYRPLVEWISFFYYSYFYVMASVLLPSLFFDRGRRLQELMIGAFLVASLGHVIYTLVPGVGPFRTIDFAEPINGGFWWGQVLYTVEQAGSQLDIFPSLHTAYPTLFALHAFGHRDRAPFKQLWPVIAFFAFNTMIATMFLRWHWMVDVIAGLLLAVAARSLGVAVAEREADRAAEGRQPVWEPLWSSRR